MPTGQAVWPADLIERRRRVLQLERQLRCAVAARSVTERAGVDALRAALAQCPCAHWDVEITDDRDGSWSCVVCLAVITPMWVATSEQEQSLRHAARQCSARHQDI
ncbi:hypothetical protein [Nakamurella deserti]|uniref:hypothetical protein n=1 Tax=Nakamurella deserti TaxID=2164074 RepID=UPI000DBE3556|nr:hypothetical protein [Nakamurella deserti]